MKLLFTRSFRKEYANLSLQIQLLAEKKLQLLLQDSRHPSLRIKKMKGVDNLWEGSITKSYRFTFQVEKEAYILRRIGTHDILRNP